jgi:hypothetical protein
VILRWPRRVLAAAAATSAGLALAGAPPADAVPSVTFKCTPAPQDCAGWFRSNVAIHWTVLPSDAARTGCQDKTYTTDTPGTNEYCSASDNAAVTTVQLKIRRDATPPVVTGGFPARAADANGWYNHAVLLSFRGTDRTSGVAACTSTVYGGPDSASASVAGRCTDKAGNTSSPLGYRLKYDATGPEVGSVRPARAPDAFGWFTRPVRLDVFGADALSGLAECPSTVYGGPDGLAAQASVTCRDRAANTSTRAFALSYDDTAPRIARLVASPGDHRIDVRWRRAPDAVSVKVVRSPGRGSAAESVVYSGPGRKFRDRRVRNGKRYTYRVRLADAAGHVTVRSVSAEAGPSLVSPRPRATRKAHRPLTFRWTPVRHAGYYNLQIYRNGQKILSAWPGRPRYRLKRSWSYGGQRRHLSQGTYTWYVWPGYGTRSDQRFGRSLGHRILRLR